MNTKISLREQAIAYIKKKRDVEMAIASVWNEDERYKEITSWHIGEAGAYQCVLDALEENKEVN